jgi:hypothetical protein
MLGRFARLGLRSGRALVKPPRSPDWIEMDDSLTLPLGTLVDVSNGVVDLSGVLPRAGGGPQARVAQRRRPRTWKARIGGGIFRARQTRRTGVVTVSLADAKAGRCTSPRRLSVDGTGPFVLRGRFATATVKRGAWLVEDTCAATKVRVRRGSARVAKLPRGKARRVGAGRSLSVKRRG